MSVETSLMDFESTGSWGGVSAGGFHLCPSGSEFTLLRPGAVGLTGEWARVRATIAASAGLDMLHSILFKPNYRELTLFKAYAGLRAEASRTHLSVLWWILEPILFMSVFYTLYSACCMPARRRTLFLSCSWAW